MERNYYNIINRFSILLFILICNYILLANDNKSLLLTKNYSINNGLLSNNVTSCIQDFEGYMWFCTDKGLSKFDGHSFQNYELKKDINVDGELIFGYRNESKKEVWFFSTKGEFVKYFNHQFSTVTINLESQKKIFFLGNIWNIDGAKIHNESTGSTYFLENKIFIHYIFELEKNTVVINNKLYKADKNNLLKLDKDFGEFDVNIPVHLSSFSNSMTIEKNQVKNAKNTLIYFSNKIVENINVPNLDVRNYVNFKDYLFFAGMSGGLVIYDLKTKEYHKYLDEYVCHNVYLDKDGNIWVLTRNNGIFIINYNANIGNIDNTNIFGFAHAIFPNILTGDHKGNVYLIDSTNKILFKHSYVQELNFDYVRAINGLIFKSNYYFISDLGFSKLDANFNSQLIHNMALRYLTKDSSSIYFSTNKYLYKYYEGYKEIIYAGNNIKQLYNFNNKIQVIQNDTIYNLTNDKIVYYKYVKDIVKAYSKDELIIYQTISDIIFNYKNKKIVFNFTKYNFNYQIKKVKIQNDSTFWIATSNGFVILKYRNNNFEYTHFNIETGTSSNIINDIEIVNDKVFFATENGFTINNIYEFEKGNKKKYFQIITNLKEDTTYVIAYNKQLKINLSTLYFHSFKNIKYEYYLEKKDNKESKVEKITTIEPSILFTNLQAGDYVLHIKAINSSDVYSNNEVKISIKVLPPFYQTWWFYSLIGFIFLIIIGLIIYIYINKIKTDNNIMRLQTLSLQSQMNPHFIFNSLNSINSFIYNNNKNEANVYLSKISHLIRKSLDYSTIRSISLYDEINLLKNYLEIEKMRFGDKLNYTINISPEIETEEIEVPPFFTQIMAENAILHGVSKIDKIGQIDIEFKLVQNQLIYMVKDNGKGIEIKDNKEHQSKGLKLLNQRIQIFNRNSIENVLVTNQIENNEIVGAISTLTLKIQT